MVVNSVTVLEVLYCRPRIVELVRAAERQGLRKRLRTIPESTSSVNLPEKSITSVVNGRSHHLRPQSDNDLPTPEETSTTDGSPKVSEVLLTEEILDQELPPLISAAMDWMYLNSDTELVQLCAHHGKHYSSSTSVTVLILAGYCCVGHLVRTPAHHFRSCVHSG